MQGTLYSLTNIINGKKYIGKTYTSPHDRWLEHKRDSRRYRSRPLYKAITEFGPENFILEVLGEFEEQELEDQEQVWIEALDTFRNGYNATIGGEGRPRDKPTPEIILATFKRLGEVIKTASELRTDHKRVSRILSEAGINTKTSEKPVVIDQLNLKFDSVTKCADYLISEGLTTNKYIRNKIYDVLNGRRKTCLKYTFSYGARSVDGYMLGCEPGVARSLLVEHPINSEFLGC